MNETNKKFTDNRFGDKININTDAIERLIHDLEQMRYRFRYDEAIKVQAKVIEIKLLK